jgi:DNA-directed RNA polymerase subunit L
LRINIVRQEGEYMELEFSGEGHTLLNLLQSSLLEDPEVEMAGYSKPHPLMDRAKLFIKLRKGEGHLEAVRRAAEAAGGKLDEFIESFEASLREYRG